MSGLLLVIRLSHRKRERKGLTQVAANDDFGDLASL